MMTLEIILIIVGFIVLAGLNVFLWRSLQGGKKDNRDIELVLNQLSQFRQELDTKLGESTKSMHDSVTKQFSESQKLIKDITQEVTSVKETGKQMVSFADQLQHLQDVLQNPKQRGVLGEYYLETVLKNVLPPKSYQMQYRFENGEAVDAVVFLADNKILPVDSKFSLENYNRILETRDDSEREKLEKEFKNDLKKRIDETSKYIRPKENTMDFAFMFIPSEGIYYDLLVNQVGAVKTNTRDLIEYAFKEKKVIIVSPTSFLAYLQTVLQGLKSLQIEEQAQEIQKRVGELGRHLKTYEEYHDKLGNALGTVVNHYNRTGKEFQKIDKDVTRITGETPELEVSEVTKPQLGD